MMYTKKKLKHYLEYEKQLYSNYMFFGKYRFCISRLKREPVRMIYDFLVYSRKSDYYKCNKNMIFEKIAYLYYTIRKNNLGEKLGLEIGTENTEEGLMIYHYNNVINGSSKIGKNCKLHGNNCIGNNGVTNDCPIIGDNVSLGVGAKVIGYVTIANNIKIAAGAVVVSSFLEEGITIGGIPARKIK
ncbi:MAG: 2,3,4,5-tetrahydropyridine-2,6-carboxylate N-succinyltransferase [Bacteroidetes bacterium]|nr:2,3,4,5-tetrahydropyridine-2,6-carboxylate N-succinyltransferase [Bacteroidota bacterium]